MKHFIDLLPQIYYWLGAIVFWILVLIIAFLIIALFAVLVRVVWPRTFLFELRDVVFTWYKYRYKKVEYPADSKDIERLILRFETRSWPQSPIRISKKWTLKFLRDELRKIPVEKREPWP